VKFAWYFANIVGSGFYHNKWDIPKKFVLVISTTQIETPSDKINI
jgi:hypothetical protein